MLTELVVRAVEACRRSAAWVVPAILLASLICGYFAVTHLSVDADESKLISPDLPWQQREARYETLFPGGVDTIVIVVDGTSPETADSAAAALAARLTPQTKFFSSVNRPDAGPFFRRNGLLFLDTPELSALSEQLIKAQPMLGGLAADPSLRGLFGALKLAITGALHGEVDPTAFAEPIEAVAAAIDGVLAGHGQPVAWQKIVTGRAPTPQELRRFIIVKPVLDYTQLQPGGAASAAIRTAAQALELTPEHGVRVRLTGSVALADEELASVEKGAALSTGLSIALVALFLFLALRSIRLIIVVLATLIAGFAWTAGFAVVAVGELNVISIAFAVMFLGIAVDFAIQFTVRYRHERHTTGNDATALRTTARALAKPLSLATATTAFGFLSFIPTDYRGVSELGLIAAAGMAIALALTLTLLPALLTLVRPAPEREPVGFTWAAPIDRLLRRRRIAILVGSAVIALAAALTLPGIRFDFNPLHLQDPNSEAMATLLDLMNDPLTTPYAINALAPSPDAASALATKLAALPEVEQVVTLDSFIPEDQDKKLAIISDLAFFLGPVLAPSTVAAPPSVAELRASAEALRMELDELIAKGNPPAGIKALATALEAAKARDGATWMTIQENLVPGLTTQIGQLRDSLGAEKVSRATLPPELTRDWVAPDGEIRLEIVPRGDVRDNDVLVAFRQAVQRVVPEATGAPVTIQESGRTVSRAFVIAGLSAAITITLVLLIALRRLRDVVLVLTPLLFSALLTMATSVAAGLPLNFANVIALPLLLGIGVAFDIYFVTGWRAGQDELLQSATARAILFSALTTVGAFGTLILSSHRGTAEMGALLVIALGYALLATLFFLPPLLGPPPPKSHQSRD